VVFDAAIRYDHPLFFEAVECRPVNHALRAATTCTVTLLRAWQVAGGRCSLCCPYATVGIVPY
jgi:hypothetical protein